LDRAVILLDEAIEVAAGSHRHVLPPGILLPQQAPAEVGGGISVKIDLPGPGRAFYPDGLAKEFLRRGDGSILAKKGVDGLAIAVDSPIEVMPSSSHRHRCFIHGPGGMGGL